MTEPVEPTHPNASCRGMPAEVSQLDGYSPAGTAGRLPRRVRVAPPTGVNEKT